MVAVIQIRIIIIEIQIRINQDQEDIQEEIVQIVMVILVATQIVEEAQLMVEVMVIQVMKEMNISRMMTTKIPGI